MRYDFDRRQFAVGALVAIASAARGVSPSFAQAMDPAARRIES